MNIDDVKTLVELVSERDIEELELEDAGVKLRIKKANSAGTTAVAASVPVVLSPAASASAPEASNSPAAVAPPTNEPASTPASPTEDDSLQYIKSPMVGTFYRQPEPGAEPFISEGDTIKKGQVLCIIEAMKLMNEIESELQGELVKVLVENGQSVQYGDPLFAIREA